MSAQLPLLLTRADYPPGFLPWAERNPDICDAFCRLALQLQRRGISRGSADDICHHLRWRSMLRERGRPSKFKVNNNATSGLARLAMERYPGLTGWFALRAVRGESPGQ